MQRRFALIKHTHDLGDIGDFSVSSPTEGQVLEYDSTTSKWVNVEVANLVALPEAVQDIVGAMLLDTASVNLTYNDGTGQLSADVLPAGVDHDSLLNFVADEHVAHSGVTLTAGAGLTGGGTIAASRTFAVGAGTGITVNADDVALSAATIASLALADTSVQPGDNVSVLTNDAGYITSASLPVGANPSASVGLTAVNGSASTFMRSDAAPPLDQSIAPTWTGHHTFASSATVQAAGAHYLQFRTTAAAADEKAWLWYSNDKNISFRTFDDAIGADRIALNFVRGTGIEINSIVFGNGTDNPSYTFSGTGPVVVGGQVQLADGTTSVPSLSFSADTDTGLNRISSGRIGMSFNGARRVEFQDTLYIFGVASGYIDALSWTERVGVSSATNNALVGVNLSVVEGVQNRRVAFYLDDSNGTFGLATTASSGVPEFSYLRAGTEYLRITDAGQVKFVDGSASVPSLSFLSDPNTGVYNLDADKIGFSCGGTEAARLTSSYLEMASGVALNVISGSAASPGVCSRSDTNTGLYWIAADQLGFSEGGTGYRIGYRDIPRRTSGWARGECLAISAGVTLNTSDMGAGYAFSVYNDSGSSITITQGSGVTLRFGGATGNRTLAARGFATIWCNSGTEAVIMGSVS